MKSKVILFIVFIIFIKSNANNSDSLAFNNNKIILSIGYGFPNLDKKYTQDFMFNGYSSFKTLGNGPFHFRAEYGISNKISLGISINLNTYGGTWKEVYTGNNGIGTIQQETYNYKKEITSVSGLIRFNYHVFTTKKLDPYFSFGAGIKKISIKFNNDNDPNSFAASRNDPDFNYGFSDFPAALEAVAGLRYYVSSHIGVYSEIGIAKSAIQFGLTIGL